MQDANPSPTHLRTALFVDFDNIYLGLQREDPVAAEQFATDPTRWLTWLQDRLPHHFPNSEGGDDHRRRKILFRRCYLNPSQFGRFRPYFTRSAIEVVDCPPLTSGGKTSADIHMVMDILDTLSHATRFDEFILLSGDADFTPVLLRLSKHDRRSAILAIGPASVAYKAACDLLIDQDTFLEEAIGATPNPTARAAAGLSNSAMSDLLRGIADKIYERASTSGELVATELPPIFREFSEFTSSNNWLGFNSLRNMTTAVVSMRRDLTMIDGDPWRVGLLGEGEEPAEAPEASHEPDRTAPAPRFLTATDRNRLIEEILAHVRSVVDSSDSAVPMARAAQMVISRFGDQVLATRWAGAGTFRDLLEGRENPGFAISALKPGYIYDPMRHQLPIDGRPEELVGDPQLNALAYRVHQLTDTPYLTRGDYARVFRLTAEEVNDHGYFLTRTSKSVRDRCIEEGSPIARASVNFILRGITFGGHRFGQNGSEEPLDLGACFFRNVVSLCDTAGIALDDHERETLSDWILGELRAEEGPAHAARPREGADDEREAVAAAVASGGRDDSGPDSES